MRLTLRTLLAYLDDTLDATEIKGIGQKVAESDAAQELIARIKQVTRRRRLTTPPLSGPNARFEPNDVAEYLDNELTSDKVAELEKIALESDVHLAEIASCHQILTLVLGEPALVPPTARTRMYGLVTGGKAAPAPKPAQPAKAPGAGDEEDLLGLPILRHGWLRWVLPLAGVFLLVALGIALWQAFSDQRDHKQVANNGKSGPEVARTTPEADGAGKGDPDKGKGKETKPEQEAEKDAKKEEAKKDKEEKQEKTDKGTKKKPEKATPETEEKEADASAKAPDRVERTAAPSTDRAAVARYVGAPERLPSVLVSRAADEESWRRVRPTGSVYSTDSLVSLPGYMSELVSKKGATLLLRGSVPEFAVHPAMTFLMESAVVLHKNDNFDLDLTLQRGRIYLGNQAKSGPVKVRLRFEDQVWDLTLQEPGAEVGVDLQKHFTRDINYRADEDPRAELELGVLKGEAELRFDFQTHRLLAPPGPARFSWNNFERARGPIRLEQVPRIWDKMPPLDQRAAKDMDVALKGLAGRLERAKDVAVAFKEGVERDESPQATRLLSVYCMAAIDEMGDLLDRLEDADPAHVIDRQVAIFALRRWISRSAKQGRRLYQVDKKTGAKSGLLLDRKFRPTEAQTLFDLLHDFSDEDGRNPDTYVALAAYLESPKVAIAELSYWHLLRLTQGSDIKLPPFNGAIPEEDRKAVATQVLDLVKKGKLPPPAPRPKDSGRKGGE